ncbi:MAG: hypothetical protein D6689_10020 [Deltaproteobacteria bacterium]|nr:MAG: hypothetical protein D6689_10020 [Deltaproteobacteria bacterium]
MLIAAIVCGLVTAYYFGVRAGAYAAAGGAACALAATVVPQVASWAYAAIAAWLVGVAFAGPRWGRPPAGARAAVRAVAERARRWRRARAARR